MVSGRNILLRFFTVWGVFLYSLYTPNSLAKIEDILDYEKKAQESAFKQFTEFTKDKNLQGKAQKPDGTDVSAPPDKQAFDRDKKTNFQSDLTYHLKTFPTPLQSAAGQPPERIPHFVSSHGNIEAAGGSSFLERLVWKWHKIFEREDRNGPPAALAHTGVRRDSVFEITTLKVDPTSTMGGDATSYTSISAAALPPPSQDIDRKVLRKEVENEVAKAGNDATQTILEAAKSRETQGRKVAPNLSRLYEAAKRSTTIGFWNSTVANQAQRRAYVGIRTGSTGEKVKLSEDIPTCEQWQAKTMANLQQGGSTLTPEQQKDIETRASQCQKMILKSYSAINPGYVAAPTGTTGSVEQLEDGGTDKEDSIVRDLRVQAELATGKKLGEIASNWPYKEEEAKSLVTLQYDNDGNPTEQRMMTMQEQIRLFNEQKKAARQGYEEAKKYLPDLNVPKITMTPENISAMKNNQPIPTMMEEMGVKQSPSIPVPDSYGELLGQAN